ncbi:hypothetical protein ABZW11_21370 [Nonomuraea sp. NPDC004580]|uniref:hypothetical protein n=1 Tax=Nonomuraea sp. NPDC004580 TaxID=3154552 RepID=UPI0033B51ABB
MDFSKSRRCTREAGRLAAVIGEDQRTVRAKLVGMLAAVAATLQRDLREDDWQRPLDALVLILAHPSE